KLQIDVDGESRPVCVCYYDPTSALGYTDCLREGQLGCLQVKVLVDTLAVTTIERLVSKWQGRRIVHLMECQATAAIPQCLRIRFEYHRRIDVDSNDATLRSHNARARNRIDARPAANVESDLSRSYSHKLGAARFYPTDCRTLSRRSQVARANIWCW